MYGGFASCYVNRCMDFLFTRPTRPIIINHVFDRSTEATIKRAKPKAIRAGEDFKIVAIFAVCNIKRRTLHLSLAGNRLISKASWKTF